MRIKKTKIWKITSIAFAVLFIAALVFAFTRTGTSGIGDKGAEEKVINFFKTYQNLDISVDKVESVSGMYKVSVSANGQKGDVYVSKDGNFLGSMTDLKILNAPADTTTQETTPPPAVTKSDKPKVELFIMSYCPYGTQTQKALIPAWELLGSKADISVKFVDYIMHGDKEAYENVRQYCIQKEQNDKYTNYLKCFLKEGKYEGCIAEANIDSAKLAKYMNDTDKAFDITANLNDKSTWLSGTYPPFSIHKDLNDKYGVQGSPTVVINGAQANVGRSAEAMKAAICAAFNIAPTECSTTLDNNQESAGFGFAKGTAASATAAQCG